MSNKNRYFLVDSSVLPEVFVKVVEAKELLAKNTAKNSSHACELVGLSRSTFYRYRDCVDVYKTDNLKTVTLILNLEDKPGVLASVLDFLRNNEANVLTINQNIPINGVADVCISFKISNATQDIFSIVSDIKKLEYVVGAKIV